MKLKIKDLKYNPFKKMINKGKLNEVQIKEISGNLEELGYMGAIPVVNIKGKYHIVNCHHRIEALRRKFGGNYEVPVTIHNYNDDQLIKGMVIENLSQRGSDFKEELENIRAVEEYLNNDLDKLKRLRDSRRGDKREGMKNEYKNGATARDIKAWLQLSEEKWSDDIILQIMNIYTNLDKDLLKNVNYVRGGKKEDEKDLSVEDAKNLSRINKEEQKKMKELLDETGLDHKKKSKLITSYNAVDEETKKKLLTKQIDIRDIDYETQKSKYLGDTDYAIQHQTVGDWIVEVSEKVKEAGEVMNVSKIDRCNKTQLDLLYRYIKVDFEKYYKPFLNKLMENIQTKEVKVLK